MSFCSYFITNLGLYSWQQQLTFQTVKITLCSIAKIFLVRQASEMRLKMMSALREKKWLIFLNVFS